MSPFFQSADGIPAHKQIVSVGADLIWFEVLQTFN
jgi:hypothetical protein